MTECDGKIIITVDEILRGMTDNEEEYARAAKQFGALLDIKVETCFDRIRDLGDLKGVFFGDLKNGEAFPEDNPPVFAVSAKDIPGIPTFVVKEAPIFYWRRLARVIADKFRPRSVVITGSYGKTTTMQMTCSVLQQAGRTTFTPNNENTNIGQVWALTRPLVTYDYFTCELGLSQKNYYMSEWSKIIKPEICVIVNIGSPHIENFGDKSQILEEKLHVADGMSEEKGLLILNADDETSMAKKDYRHKIKTIAVNTKEADYTCRDIAMSNDGIDFVAVCRDREFNVHLNLTGKHNVYSALAAIAVADSFGVSDDKIAAGLALYKTSGTRQNVYTAYKNNIIIEDCFGASLEADIVMFDMLREFKAEEGQRKIAVLGHVPRMGRLSDQVHRDIAKKLASDYDFDMVVTYGGLSRYFSEEYKKAGKSAYHFYDDEEFVAFLKENIREKDIILFKGVWKTYNFTRHVRRILNPDYKAQLPKYCGTYADTASLHTTSPSSLLFDASDGRIVCGKNIHTRYNPASLITIASVLTLLENGMKPDDIVTIPGAASAFTKGWFVYGVKAGERYRAGDLMWLSLKKSGTDALYSLILSEYESVEAFMKLWRETVLQSGAVNTGSIGPYGKDSDGYYSTAFDLALIISRALKNKDFLSLISDDMREITELTSGERKRESLVTFLNTRSEKDEHLLYTPGVIQIKEGENHISRKCVAAAVKRGEKYYVSVVLGSVESHFNMFSYDETKRMLDFTETLPLVKKEEVSVKTINNAAFDSAYEYIDSINDPELLDRILENNYETSLGGSFWKYRQIHLESKDPLERKRALLKCQYIQRVMCASVPVNSNIHRFGTPHGLTGIHISARAKIGTGCTILQGVTIGSNTFADSKKSGFPVIGNNVFIGAGAKIIGGVTVGDNVRIGANCIVVEDVPANSVVVMEKPKIISKPLINNKFLSPDEYDKFIEEQLFIRGGGEQT
ncbi:MAG TPA: hypothetical protein DDX91_03360 [Ruminococcaceae bacterium]|nr:hypothetical protein [Oscillospiraceae bacterium]